MYVFLKKKIQNRVDKQGTNTFQPILITDKILKRDLNLTCIRA